MTSPGNPQCHGQTENFNRTMIRMIKFEGPTRYMGFESWLFGWCVPCYSSQFHRHDTKLFDARKTVRIPNEVMYGSQNPCQRCPYTGTRSQTETHWLKHHCPEDDVPFRCGACGNRAVSIV
jgi:hypothetical protein